ncbi:hypothetical protein ACTMNS_06740, partial [Staphylococcus haemolyticus]
LLFLYLVQLCKIGCLTAKPNNLDRRFRIYRETLSRFSCAASVSLLLFPFTNHVGQFYYCMDR